MTQTMVDGCEIGRVDGSAGPAGSKWAARVGTGGSVKSTLWMKSATAGRVRRVRRVRRVGRVRRVRRVG